MVRSAGEACASRTIAAESGVARYLAKPDLRPMRRMTPAEIEAAARSDPDAMPFSAAELARMMHTPRAKLIRRALGLTQEEFAARFQIPLGTLRDWEQGAAAPDQAARAYLRVIASDPEAVRRALDPASRPRL